jgi:very-short-patch-repair endonuclease/DNA-directed RNA polymerase subunit RPC12/RpoP
METHYKGAEVSVPRGEMKTIDVVCEYCASTVTKPLKEYTRSMKKGMKMFCSNSCGAKFNNHSREMPDQEAQCELCSSSFMAKRMAGRWTRFCSRECASKGSYNENRRQSVLKLVASGFGRGNLITASAALKMREAWKYVELASTLQGVSHEFEYPMGNSVYDLALFDSKIIIEFDGDDHRTQKQQWIDRSKDISAKEAGFTVVRVPVEAAKVIPASAISHIKYARQQQVAA